MDILRPCDFFQLKFFPEIFIFCRVSKLARSVGVALTEAGATYPYGCDPKDKNLRIAPSCPTLEELEQATHIVCQCVRLASAEKLLANKE